MVKFTTIDHKNVEILGHKIKEDSIIYPIFKILFVLILIGTIIYNTSISITKIDDIYRIHFNTTSALLILLPLIIFIIFLSKVAKRKVIKEKLSLSDFNNYKDYYRDLIVGYSPIILSYIDNFTIDKNAIIATKIQLKEPNRQLTKLDNYILNENYYNKTMLKSLIEKETVKKGLLEISNKKYDIKKHITLSIVILILISFLSSIVNSYVVCNSNFCSIAIYIISKTIRLIYFIYALVRLLYMFHKNNNPLIRTKKGEEINLKLDGLKNFMQDFTNLDERTQSEIKLWGDYLIYSIMFGQNKKVKNNDILN